MLKLSPSPLINCDFYEMHFATRTVLKLRKLNLIITCSSLKMHLTESEFPTDEVRKLEERLKEEYLAYVSFLQQQNQQQQQNLEGMALVIEGMDSAIREIKIRVEIIPTKDDVAQIMEQKMKDLKLSPTQERPGNIDNNNYNIIIH